MTAKSDAPSAVAAASATVAAAATEPASASDATTTHGGGATSPIARSLSSPTKSEKSATSSPKNRLSGAGARFGKTVTGGFASSPTRSPQHAQQMMMSPSQTSQTTTGRDASRNDLTLQRRGSHFDLDFQKRDSVNNIRREVETIQQSTTFFHRDFDKDIHVFAEIPDVKVLGGRSEEAWPTRYVEYDVEVRASSLYIPPCMHYMLVYPLAT